MTTPILDFLIEYAKNDPIRVHMPGHKGHHTCEILREISRYDITEIPGADSLFRASGIIAESEENAATLFGTAATCYSCAGSTLSIQAMLLLMREESRTVIAARNVHRAFVEAAALLDLDIVWIYPNSGSVISGAYPTEDFRTALDSLEKAGKRACVYVTSPDYHGVFAEVSELSLLCRTYDAPLLVDNAHGAHLAFLPEPCHPIALGADYCCDSAHKMLSGLTGTGYLHAKTASPETLRRAMATFASTSPSYLQLASLDWCNREIASPVFRNRLKTAVDLADDLRARFSGIYTFSIGDPLHVTIFANNFDGRDLADFLAARRIVVEYADRDAVVMLFSAETTPEDVAEISHALALFASDIPKQFSSEKSALAFPRPERILSMREALFSPKRAFPVASCLGKICAATDVPCPPAIPIVLAGEKIDWDVIDTLQAYDIKTVSVVDG